MALPTFQEYKSSLDHFKKVVEQKTKAFEGHEDVLNRSLKTSILNLPSPISLLAEDIYDKTPGLSLEKIKTVTENLDHIERLGESKFTSIKTSLDPILKGLAGSNFDIVVPNDEETGDKVLNILITEDENLRSQLVQKLNHLLNSFPPT